MGSIHRFPDPPRDIPLTKKQVAQLMGRTPRWIEMRMRDSGFPHRHKGHFVFFSLKAITEWARDHGHEFVDYSSLMDGVEERTGEPAASEPMRIDLAQLKLAVVALGDSIEGQAHGYLEIAGAEEGHSRELVDRGLSMILAGLMAAVDPETPPPSPSAA